MNAIIITIGDEILSGDTIDSNAAWIARQLNQMGVQVTSIITVSDQHDAILNAFETGWSSFDIVITTGGLGPTKDDLTKECFADFFDTQLVEKKDFRKRLEEYYRSRGRRADDVTTKMVSMPESATILRNDYGVAPGLMIQQNQKLFVSLPGIPYEMKGIFNDELIPIITKTQPFSTVQSHHFMTAGRGETELENRLQFIEQSLPSNFSLAFLPSFANVKVRLTAYDETNKSVQQEMNHWVEKIREQLSDVLYSENKDDTLVHAIAKQCNENKQTIATAESCTGGHVAHKITSVPGSSSYYLGSIISYSNELKRSLLDVSEETLKKYGAVSEETVIEMVQGALKTMGSDYAVATSGIAGPTGGTESKEVGLVWVGVGCTNHIVAKSFNFTKKREKNIQLFTMTALNQLYRFILNNE